MTTTSGATNTTKSLSLMNGQFHDDDKESKNETVGGAPMIGKENMINIGERSLTPPQQEKRPLDGEQQQQQTEATPAQPTTTKESSPPPTTSGDIPPSSSTSLLEHKRNRHVQALIDFYWTYEFIIEVMIAIFVAWLYPPLGAQYLKPSITSTWIAVAIIFILSGLGLKLKEFTQAIQLIYFNCFVQLFNFGLISIVSYFLREALIHGNILSKSLADGLVVNGCLPMTINTVIVFTKTAGGNEAAAIFNSTFANILGVFLSPALILMYLGVSGNINLGEVFLKLALTVVLPITVGMILQQTSKQVAQFAQDQKKYFKYIQQYALVYIVYCTFCQTFDHNNHDNKDSKKSTSLGDIFLMIALIFVLLIAFMILAWYMLQYLFHDQPQLRVMGLFGCTQKTAAVGVPLVSAIYGKDPLLAYYLLPLLIWYPIQLLVGSMLVPKLALFVQREQERLSSALVVALPTGPATTTIKAITETTASEQKNDKNDTKPSIIQSQKDYDQEAAVPSTK